MIINLYGSVDNEMLTRFFDYCNKAKNEDIIIYLSSDDGGEIRIQKAITDVINKEPQRFTLIGVEFLVSAAFDLFFMAKCKKRLTKGTVGMTHFGWTTVDMNESGAILTDSDKFMMKELKRNKEETINFFKELGLTQKEINHVKRGKNLWLSHERMEQLIKNQQNG